MQINAWNIELGVEEAKAAYDSIMNRNLSEGSKVRELEEKLATFLGRKYAICVPNGSSAVLLAMMGIGISPGDEVIIPARTFIATGHAPKLLGATVVIADTREDLPLLDVEQALNLVTKKTKAIIPVHLNGRRADTKKLKEALAGTGIYIIDDACQAFGSGHPGDYMGAAADIACYSFAVTKIMTTAQGGFVATDDEELYRRMKKLKMQGMDNIFESNDYQLAGFNLKYTDILASIGLVQLKKMPQKILASKENYQRYVTGLADIADLQFMGAKDDEVIYAPDVICSDTSQTRAYLEAQGIQVRPAGASLHRAPYFEQRSSYPHAEYFESHILYLPGGPNQNPQNIDHTIECLKKR